jgi:hypothetical protein
MLFIPRVTILFPGPVVDVQKRVPAGTAEEVNAQAVLR